MASTLMGFLPAGSNIDQFARVKRSKCRDNVQPYMICVQGTKNAYFIQADELCIHREDKFIFVAAFDLLFKFFFAMNLKYPDRLYNLFSFVETCIYKIGQKKSRSVITSLDINLCNCKMNKEED